MPGFNMDLLMIMTSRLLQIIETRAPNFAQTHSVRVTHVIGLGSGGGGVDSVVFHSTNHSLLHWLSP